MAKRAKYSTYKSRNSRIKNKIRRLQKHLKKIPSDKNAAQALKLFMTRLS